MIRVLAATTITGLLAGCGTGFPINGHEIGSPRPNDARLIVYRPSGVMLTWRSFGTDVNGAPGCDLSSGGGFAMDVGSGKLTVAAHLWGMEGESSRSWMAEPGKTYFLRVKVAGEDAPGAVGGVFGLGSNAPAASAGSGPFDLQLTDEATALASGVLLSQCPG